MEARLTDHIWPLYVLVSLLERHSRAGWNESKIMYEGNLVDDLPCYYPRN